ncbi:MAG: hypothetical protein A2X96_11530 [Syntrophobacterales bacterium GWC2_56_13]|nr:MAG: hypothetical protein A2X96_11530 [Syntrophobacterales bacterium GWC2_56_13]
MLVHSHSVAVSAVSVFVDVRGFTPLSTSLTGPEVNEVLKMTRADCFVTQQWDSQTREGWPDEDQQRYKSASLNLWAKYNENVPGFPYTFGRIKIQDVYFEIAAFHKFLGDGIMFIFELGPASERAEAEDKLNTFAQSINQSVSSKDEIVNAVIEWATELSLWRPNTDRVEAFSKKRLTQTRLGIGVSYGIITRVVFDDTFSSGNSFRTWDYHGDAINRSARLENFAKPGGAVFDVGNSYFRKQLKNMWKNMMRPEGKPTDGTYFFSRFPDEEDVRGIGKIPLFACGETGRIQLESSDKLCAADDVTAEQEAIRKCLETGIYEKFRRIPENILSKENIPSDNTIAVQMYGEGAILVRSEVGLLQFEECPKFSKCPSVIPDYRDHLHFLFGQEAFTQWQFRTIAMRRENTSLFDGEVVKLVLARPNEIVAAKSGYYWSGALDYTFDKRASASPFSGADLLECRFSYADQLKCGLPGECFNNSDLSFSLKDSLLGNHVGINLMVWVDDLPDGLYLLYQSRSGVVHVEKNKLCPTGSGTLNWDDVQESENGNALALGAIRELRRETGLKVSPNHEELSFLGLTREKNRIGTPDGFFGFRLGKLNNPNDKANPKWINLEEGIDKHPIEKEEWGKLLFVHFVFDPSKKWFFPSSDTGAVYRADVANRRITLTAAPNIGIKTDLENLNEALAIPGRICTYLLFEKLAKSMELPQFGGQLTTWDFIG